MAENTTTATAPAPAAPEAAPLAAEVAAPAPEVKVEPPRTFKVKVDGQEMEVDQDELLRGYQLSKAGYKRLEEATTLKRQVEAFISDFEKDPVATMRHLASRPGQGGAAFREAVEKYLYAEYQKEQLSPEKRALMEAEEKLRAAEEEKRQLSERQKAEQLQRQQAYWAKKYDESITEALADPEVGLPKVPSVVKRMADLMGKSLKLGIEVDTREVAKLVKKEYLEAQRELVGKLDGESLYRYLGEDTAKKIRAYEVAQLKVKPTAPASAQASSPAKDVQAKQGGKPMRERDFEDYVKKVARGEA